MSGRLKNPRQFAFRVSQNEADKICAKALAANLTPTTYARLAVLEKIEGESGAKLIKARLKVIVKELKALGEQLASIAFEVRDFRERFDKVVIEDDKKKRD
jgi:hypothetical protein